MALARVHAKFHQLPRRNSPGPTQPSTTVEHDPAILPKDLPQFLPCPLPFLFKHHLVWNHLSKGYQENRDRQEAVSFLLQTDRKRARFTGKSCGSKDLKVRLGRVQLRYYSLPHTLSKLRLITAI